MERTNKRQIKTQPLTAALRNGGCSASYGSFVVGSSAVLLSSAKNPPLPKAENDRSSENIRRQ
jgi:hypothetical protein